MLHWTNNSLDSLTSSVIINSTLWKFRKSKASVTWRYTPWFPGLRFVTDAELSWSDKYRWLSDKILNILITELTVTPQCEAYRRNPSLMKTRVDARVGNPMVLWSPKATYEPDFKPTPEGSSLFIISACTTGQKWVHPMCTLTTSQNLRYRWDFLKVFLSKSVE